MPVVRAHLTSVLVRYEAMLQYGQFEALDRELFEETWQPTAGLLTSAEIETVGPLIVDFELAVADRDDRRAREALESSSPSGSRQEVWPPIAMRRSCTLLSPSLRHAA